jgi:1,4-dihydroxy-6-naphthoate synthase
MRIRLGHSPDPDDAFMFYPLASGKVAADDYELEHILSDIQTLNEWAREGRLEVTALSVHAYAHVAERYILLPHGASLGVGYGPVLVARERFPLTELRRRTVAIPGTLTTAYLAARLLVGDFPHEVVPFDRILDVVKAGGCEAGLIIHEGQLTYREHGLVDLVDLGVRWREATGLPLPLGANAVRRDLPLAVQRDLSRLLRESIRYALAHREEALAHAMQFARGLSAPLADRFVGMYVNELSLDYGDRGRRAVQALLGLGAARGLVPRRVAPDFLDG